MDIDFVYLEMISQLYILKIEQIFAIKMSLKIVLVQVFQHINIQNGMIVYNQHTDNIGDHTSMIIQVSNVVNVLLLQFQQYSHLQMIKQITKMYIIK